MNKFIVLRMAFTLVSVGLMVFTLVPNLPTNAQDKDTCKDLGWTAIDASEVDLSGIWTGFQNRNCKESAKWQYGGFGIKITKERNGNYKGQIGNENKADIDIEGSEFVWIRDLRGGAGYDTETKLHNQTWKGKIEKNKAGRIRIYGTWTGAFKGLKCDDCNLDFMMLK